MKKFFLTTTIPYVNASPHLGHALEFVQADVICRYHRTVLGEDVYFVSGTDDNAIKNVQAAKQAGVLTSAFVEKNSALFKNLLEKLNVRVDDFVETRSVRHKAAAVALWRATKREDIVKKSYEGLYCTGCEQFYKKDDLNSDGKCFEHPQKNIEVVREENYFFKLSNYAKWIEGEIEDGKIRIIPENRKNEVLSFVRRGLEDFSISRPSERSHGWGVEVPDDPSQTMYVWYDALVNYITALGYPGDSSGLLKKYWLENENRVHVLGKGVSRFHAVYWPAMLKSAGLPAPSLELIHGYVTINGLKMSKSTGNTVDPIEIIEKYGCDAFRFWAIHDVATYEDGDFSWEKFKESYNANLANGLGNLVSRVMKMALLADVRIDFNVEPRGYGVEMLYPEYRRYMDEYNLKKAIDFIWSEIGDVDFLIEAEKPFSLIKSDQKRAKEIIYELVYRTWNIALWVEPFLPDTSSKIVSAIKDNSEKIAALFPRMQ